MNPNSIPTPGPAPMSPQPNNFGSPTGLPPRRKSSLDPIIIAVLGFLTVLFLGLFIFALTRWSGAKSDLTIQTQAAYAKGKQDQTAALDQQVKEQIETPFKSYVAPTIYGEFAVKYPKDWNAAVNEEPSGSKLDLILNPQTIKLYGNTNPYATEIILASTSYKTLDEQYNTQVKSKKLKVSDVTISGIMGHRYEGIMPDKRTGVVVLLPVRDKTMTLANYDQGYSKEFEQILAQIKITP